MAHEQPTVITVIEHRTHEEGWPVTWYTTKIQHQGYTYECLNSWRSAENARWEAEQLIAHGNEFIHPGFEYLGGDVPWGPSRAELEAQQSS